jgi:hypothetical protein
MAILKKLYTWLFYLLENAITPDPNDKYAKVKSGRNNGMTDIAHEIKVEGSEHTEATIIDLLTRANSVKMKMLSRGEKVNDGIAFYEPAITGSFYENTTFDESRNTCVINIRVNRDVHLMLQQVKAEYTGYTVDNGGAVIKGVTDAKTGELNGVITPGKIATIVGNKIRIVPEEGETVADCITWTSVATQEVTVQEDDPATNDPSKIMLTVPPLAPGFYTLALKTLYSSSGSPSLKAPRYISLKGKLQVKAAGEPNNTNE